MELKVYRYDGTEVENLPVAEKLSEGPVRGKLLWQAVKRYLAGKRRGRASTLKQGEVQGSKRKPWPQKHTGRARHGYRRSPIWYKGAVVFGPKPRSWAEDMPKKMRKEAMRSAIRDALRRDAIKVVDFENAFSEGPKTKKMKEILSKFDIDAEKQSTLIVLCNDEKNVALSARNLARADVINFSSLHPYWILKNSNIVFSRRAWEKVQEVWGK